MNPIVYAAIAGFANTAGAIALVARGSWSRRSLEFVLAFSAGFLVAVALGELVPEAVTRGGASAGLWMLGAFGAVHLTQHALVGHFHFGEETHEVSRGVATSALLGLVMHTFFDGVAIASSFAVAPTMGFLVLGAIVLHKLPEGLAIASLFIASGRNASAAIAGASLLGLATVIGAATSESVAVLTTHGLALSAGVTLYVGGSNLIPEFQGKKGWSHNLWFFAGVGAYAVAAFVAR